MVQSHRIHGTDIFTYIYHKIYPNVGKYTIHGSVKDALFGVGGAFDVKKIIIAFFLIEEFGATRFGSSSEQNHCGY